jgi:hypothetical protein
VNISLLDPLHSRFRIPHRNAREWSGRAGCNRRRLLLVVVCFVDGAAAPAEGTLCMEDVCIYMHLCVFRLCKPHILVFQSALCVVEPQCHSGAAFRAFSLQ